MQIQKINENQIEVILDLDDLNQNNISIHSFMCNSSASQGLFLNILSFANDKIGFNINNHEIIIEAFSISNQSVFVLVITRIPKTAQLHISKLKYSTFNFDKSFWIKFDKLEEFCMFCNSLSQNINAKTSLYLLDYCYFLHIKSNNLKDYFKVSALANKFSNNIYYHNFIIDENAEIIIKDFAVETAKKYFV